MGLASAFRRKRQPSPPPAVAAPERSRATSLDSASVTSKPASSRRSTSSARSHASIMADEIKHEVMCNYLYQIQCTRMWVDERGGPDQGVVIRKARGTYVAAPPHLSLSQFADSCAALDVQSAMTISSRVIKTFLDWTPDAYDVPLNNGLRVQVLASLEDLKRARKNQFAAFVAEEQLLIVWDDEASHLMERAQMIEDQLLELVWNAVNEDGVAELKKEVAANMAELDEESGRPKPEYRPTKLLNSIYVGLTSCIILAMLGAGFREIAIEIAVDKTWIRLAFLALIPIQIFFTLFFVQVIVGCTGQLFGPIKQMNENSRHYSAQLPPRLRGGKLPHITIQCPVYKEGLSKVIAPTVRSIKQAMSTYELQGGSANMFINDDGLQLLSDDDRRARIEFYANHSIGWVARPKHGEEGFVRRGKFKKASNLNYGLMISNKVEEELSQMDRPDDWSQADEALAYEKCLTEVVKEDGRAWADGNIRIGDYILLVDSDTRVPEDCLLDAASEMEHSPEIGIMQFSSGVMQVVNTYFENGITFFTDLIYTAISFCVSNGDVAPFVGHNAILRWSAIQQVSFFDEDNYEKFWSESHVSEDFDMSLRLQCNGYTLRFATWAGKGFKEGVSLTVYDELARWEKYAYGCNELIFHPLLYWPIRGPFTPLFRRFLRSKIPLTSKITIMSYIGTYYAIGAAWMLTLANYFAIGWFNGYLDKYYIDSWKVWFSIVIVFNGLGNVALAVMRYRIGVKNFLPALIENFKWVPMLAVFLGGLSLHVSSALLAHMFGVNMTWGATAKEAEFSNFFIEIPRIGNRFKWSIAFATLAIGAMCLFAIAPWIPWDWHIRDMVAILPLSTVTGSHLLLPIALNPALMTFSW